MAENETRIVMNDFSRLIEAKQMAMALMDSGVQFSFSPEPISISYPMRVVLAQTEQAVPNE